MSNSEVIRIQARKGEEHLIPKYNINSDAMYFDLDSLISMYGKSAVDEFLRGRSQEVVTYKK